MKRCQLCGNGKPKAMSRHAFIEALAAVEDLRALLISQPWAVIIDLDKNASA